MEVNDFLWGVLAGVGVTLTATTAIVYAIWRAFLMSIVSHHSSNHG